MRFIATNDKMIVNDEWGSLRKEVVVVLTFIWKE